MHDELSSTSPLNKLHSITLHYSRKRTRNVHGNNYWRNSTLHDQLELHDHPDGHLSMEPMPGTCFRSNPVRCDQCQLSLHISILRPQFNTKLGQIPYLHRIVLLAS